MGRVSEHRKLAFWADQSTGLTTYFVINGEQAELKKAMEPPQADLALEVPSDVDGEYFDVKTLKRLAHCYYVATKLAKDLDTANGSVEQMRDLIDKSRRLRSLSLADFQASEWHGFKSQFETACRQWVYQDFLEHCLVICDKMLWAQGVVVNATEFLCHYHKIWNLFREDRELTITARDLIDEMEDGLPMSQLEGC